MKKRTVSPRIIIFRKLCQQDVGLKSTATNPIHSTAYLNAIKKIDTILAALAIGVMFLAGISIFLIQLAEFGFHS